MAASESPRGMQIGEVAERTGLSFNTLRHYHEVGLVPPSSRSSGGFRLYSEEDVERLLLIRRMKPLGFTIEEMRSLLATVDALAQAELGDRAPHLARLHDFLESAQMRRAKLAKNLDRADEFIDLLRQRGAH